MGQLYSKTDAGLSWSSRKWQSSTEGTCVFEVDGRAALDLWMHEDIVAGVGQRVQLTAWGIAGEVRTMLARSEVESGFNGLALSLRDIMVPRVMIEARTVAGGATVRAWLMACCSWGREPTGGRERLEWCYQLEPTSAFTICDGPAELAWLEVEIGPELSSGIDWWVQLHDCDTAEGSYGSPTCIAQWLCTTRGGPEGRTRLTFAPREPVPIQRGAVLALSSSAYPNLDLVPYSAADLMTARWQLRRGSSAQLPVLSGGRG